MTTDLLALIASFFLCTEAVEKQMLTRDQVTQCSALSDQLERRFTELGDIESFHALVELGNASTTEKQDHRGWLAENPQLAAQLRSDAQTQLAMLRF